MKIYGQTDIGKVRDNNQDTYQILTAEGLDLCVVCDGMGGAAGGKTASQKACETFTDFVKKALQSQETPCPQEYESILRNALDSANQAVYELAKSNTDLEGMGTTLCAVLTDGQRFWAVSVGDSRIYMFAKQEIFQISHDHSFVQALVDSGAITKEESKTHPNKNIITRAVGTDKTIECDSYALAFTCDGLLICSDGLTNMVSDDELNAKFQQYTEPSEFVGHCIDSANAVGGADNITAIVLRK